MAESPLLKCDGACDEHVGVVRPVRVEYSGAIAKHDWGTFNYCEAAIEEDKRRGLTVIGRPPTPT